MVNVNTATNKFQADGIELLADRNVIDIDHLTSLHHICVINIKDENNSNYLYADHHSSFDWSGECREETC
jgi:hypothetical protein